MRRRNETKIKNTIRLLTNWTVIALKNGEVAVKGIYQSDSKTGLWQSTPIIARKDYQTVESTNNTTYKLKGQIDRQYSLNQGIPPKLVEAFFNGFPENWDVVFKNYWKVCTTSRVKPENYDPLCIDKYFVKTRNSDTKKKKCQTQSRNMLPDILPYNINSKRISKTTCEVNKSMNNLKTCKNICTAAYKNNDQQKYGMKNVLRRRTLKINPISSNKKKFNKKNKNISTEDGEKMVDHLKEHECFSDDGTVFQSHNNEIKLSKNLNNKKTALSSTEYSISTAAKGTEKRKRKLIDLMNQLNEGYQDDFFESTPLKKRPSMFGADFLETTDETVSINTPIMEKPLFQPVSAKKTPTYGTAISPGTMMQQRGDARIAWKKDKKCKKKAKKLVTATTKIMPTYDLTNRICRIFSNKNTEVTESENSYFGDGDSNDESE